ncbi:MAG UNVERIFIED_CONTAM: hypothetical protein LVR18_24970 [Planctomycetaceae bacterium]
MSDGSCALTRYYLAAGAGGGLAWLCIRRSSPSVSLSTACWNLYWLWRQRRSGRAGQPTVLIRRHLRCDSPGGGGSTVAAAAGLSRRDGTAWPALGTASEAELIQHCERIGEGVAPGGSSPAGRRLAVDCFQVSSWRRFAEIERGLWRSKTWRLFNRYQTLDAAGARCWNPGGQIRRCTPAMTTT